jgi:hypothetical protein
MPDSNLNTSIAAMRTSILNDLPTATVDELVDLSRAAKSLNLGNDSTVETAINNRSVALINGGATQAQIIQISRAVKSVLSPSTFANNIANITTITSALIPDTDVAYDLGSPSNRFNDLYLDGNTIDLGGHTIKATATGIEVPEITIGSGTNKVKLSANSSGKLEQVGTNSGGVVQDTVTGSGPASTAVTNLSDLTAIASPATGQSVLVTSTNKLYIYNGTGWYLIAEVTNLSPTAITGLNATYDLAIDGTATTITMNSTDPEGATLTWSHAITTGTLGSTATITNVNNVFTITPSTTEADAGSFSVTFSASDGSQAATSASDFTLSFGPTPSSYLFSTVGTHSWTCPANVNSVSVVCVGGGGWGGFTETTKGGDSYFINTSTVKGGGGEHTEVSYSSVKAGGSFTGDGGGNGGGWGGGSYPVSGGGAGGYSGDGGRIAGYNNTTYDGNANTLGVGADGAGGGGGSGGSGIFVGNGGGAGGGGVGVYGEGANGSGGSSTSSQTSGGVGLGGSGGSSGSSYSGGSYGGGSAGKRGGGYPGTGGGLGWKNNISVTPGASYTVVVGAGGTGSGGGTNRVGGQGAVRIVFGSGRAFPSTNVSNASNVDAETVV